MKIYRARVFTPVADPFTTDADTSYVSHDDGFIAVDGSRITSVGPWDAHPDGEIIDLGRHTLLTPGFVDTHLHAPQLEMIGSYGGHLLEWLNRYTFPTEAKFSDPDHARRVARALCDELVRHGTLCALIFSTIHREATSIFFEEAENYGLRAIIGKTMMDRNAPDYLLESAKDSYDNSRALIKQWHGRGLLRYAVTPRFAPTSTPEQLELAGALKREFPDAYVQSHISENLNEVAWVRELFPEAEYADVYDRYGLLSDRTILAHGVHLTEEELELLSRRSSRIAHCPNSNLFLGSGLFRLHHVIESGVGVGLGSDIGAGTTPSMFNAMADAYKVQQVQIPAGETARAPLSPFQLWFLATLGGARVLSLGSETGSLESGKSADFLALDLRATPLLAMRIERAAGIEDLLAALIFMGDDRAVRSAWIAGRQVWTAQPLNTKA
ncbi:MAG TPA: guanine deaminase [Thermoanaerobaculia bacterium]|nr:guanine deaminase [Thermoanaerobaculia bacterium]